MVHWSKDPKNKEATIAKISKGRKGKGLGNQNGFIKGQKSWNKDLPKEQQPRYNKPVSINQIKNMKKVGKLSFPSWNKNLKEWSPTPDRIQSAKALSRDNFQCVKCGTEKRLIVHHIKCFEKIEDKTQIQNIKNLQTLCRRCHLIVHNFQKKNMRNNNNIK